MLVVRKRTSPIKTSGGNKRAYLCSCDCGNANVVVRGDALLRGRKSCGCLAHRHSIRIINGYRAIYSPENASAMKNKNHRGYVYEHILVMEHHLGRQLNKDEVVHHKDFNKSNNQVSNLEIMSRGEHLALHNIARSTHGITRITIEDYPRLKSEKIILCRDCGRKIGYKTKTQRCRKCHSVASRKVERPTRAQLENLLRKYSQEHIGRMFGVSGKSIEKWKKSYSII